MFTGIVLERGKIVEAATDSGHGGKRLVIGHSEVIGRKMSLGASLAVAGVCLTVVDPQPRSSTVELSPETLDRTALEHYEEGDWVNLEPALCVGDPLGGHWVQGHVDGTSEVVGREDLEDHRVLAFSIPKDLSPYIVEKGSVSLDGVSLTVAHRWPDRFDVALIPHTLEVTTLDFLKPGDQVNLEVDLLAKYVIQMMQETDWIKAKGIGQKT